MVCSLYRTRSNNGSLITKDPMGLRPELTDVGMFLKSLRAHFEDDSRMQQADGELVSLNQPSC